MERNARYDDRPRVSLGGLFRLAKTAMFSFSTLPLAIFHVIGAAAAVVFLALSGFSLFCKLFTDLAIPGWTSYVLIGSFFGALNALGISILGEYVIRIYDQVRGRPLYLVDRTVNMEPGTGAAAVDDMAGDRPYAELMEQAEALLRQGGVADLADSAAGCGDANENEKYVPPVLLPIDCGVESRTCATGCAIASVHVVPLAVPVLCEPRESAAAPFDVPFLPSNDSTMGRQATPKHWQSQWHTI